MNKHSLTILSAVAAFASVSFGAQPPKPIPVEEFETLHAMFRTQPGESLFWELPWMIQLDEALKRGAEEGKPIFVWCGAGGAPVGVC